MIRFSWVLLALVACGDDSSAVDAGEVDGGTDASFDASFDGSFDAGVDVGTDGGAEDASVDVGADASAEMGFGGIAGPCPAIMAELTSDTPSFLLTRLDFADDPFDDPEDVDQLTAGGQEILDEGTLGGSSSISEVFAYEVLERCEMASLIKSETEIEYMVGTTGPSTDMLVGFDESRIGVSVTRAVGFPRDDPYTVERATMLLEDKLGDILLSTARVAPADAWSKQILLVMAYEEMHAESLETAWESIDDAVRADTIVYVVITDGMDAPVYD